LQSYKTFFLDSEFSNKAGKNVHPWLAFSVIVYIGVDPEANPSGGLSDELL
jgi:hypothetical protein